VEGVSVTIFGSQGNGVGVTGPDGRTQIALGAETPDTIIGLVASPRADYWMTWIRSPLLDPARNNIVQLLPLTEEFPDFPQHELAGWGLAAMGADRLSGSLLGQGVKVGVVDSGIAGDHRDLAGQVEGGVSVVDADPNAWNQDEEGHGTHVAGIIAGLADGGGIRGIAPGVKLRAYKIFPGGRFSDLVNALDHCIQDQVDVVNLSLGTAETSELVDQRIVLAKQQGVACVVAAGNSSGPVMFPGSSPQVMTVAAIGQRGTFPDGSWHVNDPVVGNGIGITPDGYFSPTFSCFGPEVRICAPGVAVVSSFPPNNYAALDGTSMAAPYVTGLAALVLAHHPDFQGAYRARNAARVDRLFQILMEGSRPLTRAIRRRARFASAPVWRAWRR
jgi:subtilisin family serine protease